MQEFKLVMEKASGELEEILVPEGTTFEDIAKSYQEDYKDLIVLACVDGKLRELNKEIKKDCSVKFLTSISRDGKRTYRRSMTLLMQKAIENLWGEQAHVRLLYSLGEGYYCRMEEGTDATKLAQIKEEMLRLVHENLPIRKCSVKTGDAERIFREKGMKDKERLLHYRRSSRVNIYELDGLSDYYYGYMVPSTEYLEVFDLVPYEEGFVLLFPYKDGNKVEPLQTSNKLFHTLRESREWSRMLGVGTIGGSLASQIAERGGVKFVMIAGPSSSGKTSFSNRLSIQLSAKGLKPHPVSLDDYYDDREKCPRDADGNLDFECLEALDVQQFNEDMTRLLNGEEVEMPSFNFKTGKREYRGNRLRLGEGDILVIEGIHGLNDRLSYMLPAESKFKIYISALTQLNIDEHNPLSTTDCRLLRRIVRDARTRGTTAQETLAMWPSVRRGEEKNIFPFQDSADVMFNSALLYEVAVLKVYAEPLLFQIPTDAPEHLEAKRLLKLLDYFLPLPTEGIMQSSLVREFVGGSCFNV